MIMLIIQYNILILRRNFLKTNNNFFNKNTFYIYFLNWFIFYINSYIISSLHIKNQTHKFLLVNVQLISHAHTHIIRKFDIDCNEKKKKKSKANNDLYLGVI